MRIERLAPCMALALAFSLTGCGNRLYPVQGKVTLDDGTPLTKGLVVFEGGGGEKPVSARGEIQPDGSFQLSTNRPGDGVPPGSYRALINPMDLSDIPDEQKKLPFDIKYMRLDTSELSFEVKAETNNLQIKLARPGKARK